MQIVSNSEIVITDQDRESARNALVEGWNSCARTNNFSRNNKPCDCDLGAIDGCKARVDAVARTIAAVRKL